MFNIQVDTDFQIDMGLEELEKDIFGPVLDGINSVMLPHIQGTIIRDLAVEPGPSIHPFIWSNDPTANLRARRWWFWAINTGIIPTDGERYIRSHRLSEGWTVGVVNRNREVIITGQNERDGASYVHGNDTLDQVPGHRTTGWELARDVVDRYQDETEETLEDIWFTIVDTSIS